MSRLPASLALVGGGCGMNDPITFGQRVIAERQMLAIVDPEGERDAVAPLTWPIGMGTPEESLRLVDRLAAEWPALSPNGLRFWTPTELASVIPDSADWLRHGLLAVGGITEIDGKIKAAGKTTFMLHLIRANLEGRDFLGLPGRPANVVIVTEQSRQTFLDALRRAGLDGRGRELLILFREDLAHTPWPEVVAATKRDDYELCVFDTIGKLAGIREENAAGEWAAAMAPLQDLAASGRSVLVLRHDRKGGGDVGESGRGSSQASGDVDIILALRRPEGHQPSSRRVLESLSRYAETPEKIVVELTDDGYVLLGSDEAVAHAGAVEFVSGVLGSEYRQTTNGLTRRELVELGREQEPPVKETTIRAAIETLLGRGEITESGRGVAHDPKVYRPTLSKSGETQSVSARQTFDFVDEPDPAA